MAALLTEARSWVGTPWQHNQACKDGGVDCVQFVRAVYKAIGADVGKTQNYYRQPVGNSLLDYLDSLPHTYRVDAVAPGSLLVFKIGGVPHHVGIAVDENTFIHASQKAGVVEQTLGAWKRKLVAIFEVRV